MNILKDYPNLDTITAVEKEFEFNNGKIKARVLKQVYPQIDNPYSWEITEIDDKINFNNTTYQPECTKLTIPSFDLAVLHMFDFVNNSIN